MKKAARLCAVGLISFAGALPIRAQTSSPTPSAQQVEADATLVVYNNADPDSVNLAAYYAQKRKIPLDHLVGLDCSNNEEISREEYDRTIAEPLRKTFATREWWWPTDADSPVLKNKIRFIALMRGVPLKIAATANYPGDKPANLPALNKNEASVDSELSVLGVFSRQISGPASNLYFRSFTAFLDAHLAPMMLVCRLDAPTVSMVKGMIDDSIQTEQNGLWGFACIDSRGITSGPLAEGDKWLNDVAANARKHGMPVIEDTAEAQFADDYPLRNVALYFGWYSENVSSVFAQENFRFSKGAIVCHIHSFSASTVRSPHQNWVGPLLAHGAAAVLGNVYEPYLALTPNLDIFYERLCNGFNFAESAYASVRGLSWMTTFVGDPLYRPFKVIPDSASVPTVTEWSAYRDGALAWFDESPAKGEAGLLKSAQERHSGIIYEGLGLLQSDVAHDPAAAAQSFAQAEHCYTNTSDVLRAVIERVHALMDAKLEKQAVDLAQNTIAALPKAPASNVLRAIAAELEQNPGSSPIKQP